MSADDSLPDDVEMLKRLVQAGAADLAPARAEASSAAALIAHLKLQIEKFKRELYGPRSERTARLLDQLELQLEELETAATRRRAGCILRWRYNSSTALHAQEAFAEAISGAPAARAAYCAGSDRLPLLRRRAAAQAGRRCYRDAGIDPAPMEK
jgi:Transposase C of IS166 homeodomain